MQSHSESTATVNTLRPAQASLSTAWGLAEATVFFIVPDVLLSWYAIESYRKALRAALFALAGALLGGALMWFWGYLDPQSARAMVDLVPAISPAMIGTVQQQLAEYGIAALFIGPIVGTPYKIYALEAANLGYGLALFLLVSVPARLARFVLVSLAIGAIAQVLRRRLAIGIVRRLHIAAWGAFYTGYFLYIGQLG